jgi:two-component system NtrC family sensor kinase
MKDTVRFPIRLKIMVSLLFALTAVVCVITFTMANFFHDDKKAYINDWVSIAAQSTAEECRSLLVGYQQRLELLSLILLDEDLDRDDKSELLQSAFDTFPQLVQVAVYRDGEELEVASDLHSLESSGLTEESLRSYRESHPIPADRLRDGRVYVRNSTMTEEFPTFTLAFERPTEDGAPAPTVSATVRLDELLDVGARFRVFEIFVVDDEGTLLALPDARLVANREPANLVPEAQQVHDSLRAGMTLEYSDRGIDTIGGFAGVDIGRVTVAAQMPRSVAYLASRDLIKRALAVGFVLLILVAVGGRLSARRIVRPVERLSSATLEIAKGDFEIQIDVEGRDEIGALARSFNRMTSELKTREEKLAEANTQLIQSEKLAAFGQLGAGIAHEVKNPLAGILGCAQLSLMETEEGTSLHTNVKLIEKETERCRTIIENLLKFARQDKAILEPTEINAVIEDAAAIVNHQLEVNQVKLVKELGENLPIVRGNANQLQQVLMNLMMNAQQAMEGEFGSVTVTTRPAGDDHIEVIVSDTGPGMTDDVRTRLFEPFFTTKPTGEGTGLGLSVSFGIIEDHGGEIDVASEPGEGARFTITLPVMLAIERELETPDVG